MSKRAPSTSDDEPSAKRARRETDSQSPLYDRYAWAILEYFLTSPTTTFSDTLAKMTDYLGDAFIVEEWAEATTALFSGDEDDALSLQNFRVVRAKYLSDRPSSGGDQPQTTPTFEGGDEDEEAEVEILDERAKVSRDEEDSRVELKALNDPGAWQILERFLTTDLTYSQMEESLTAYLGDRYRSDDWQEAKLAVFSGDGDDALALANLLSLRSKYIPEASSSTNNPSSSANNPLPRTAPKVSTRVRRSHKNPFIDLEANEGDSDEDEDIEIDVGPSRPIRAMPVPARRHNLYDTIDRIEEGVKSMGVGRMGVPQYTIPTRTYLFHVLPPARQFLADHLEKKGLPVVVSPWIRGHLYVTADSPRSVMSAIPESHKPCVKSFDRLQEAEETAVNNLRSEYSVPSWLRIKRGTYKDVIAYIFDPQQINNRVTVLIPPKDFPYDMPKGTVALFDPSRLPTGISPSDVIRDGKVVGLSYKGEEYYGGLLKKTFHRSSTELVSVPHPDDLRFHLQSGWDIPFVKQAEIAFSKQFLRSGDSVRLTKEDPNAQIYTVLTTDHAYGGSVKLEFKMDEGRKEIEARLVDVERVFSVGDEVKVVAGVYSGVAGHIVQKYDDIFHISQSGTQEEIQVSRYYLDRRPVDHTLQGHLPSNQYVEPRQEAATIEIGDFVRVLVGDWMGKSGTVEWTSPGGIVWLRDEAELLMSDDLSGKETPYIHVPATLVERTRLPTTIQFTKERGYDIKPGDSVCVARGPEFRTKGVVSEVDFIRAQLTLETDGDHSFIKVPMHFVMKTRNVDVDDFKKFINKEVWIIGGEKKGFRATLYGLSPDDCVVAVHGQPRMTAKRCNVATSFGCRLNGAMLEWDEFTSFCDMRRKSHIAPPPRSLTPPPERLAPVDPGPSTSWVTWSPDAVASTGPQIDAGPSTEDPWVVNPSDTLAAAEPTPPNPRDPLCWLREFALHFYTYNALFHVSAGFQGGKLVKRLASSHSPDPFCGPNGIAPPGHIAAWCTAKTAGGARVDYHIPVELLTPAKPRKKDQECFIMNGQYRGGIRTVAKCNTKNRTVDLRLLPTSSITITVSFDDICLVEPSRNM